MFVGTVAAVFAGDYVQGSAREWLANLATDAAAMAAAAACWSAARLRPGRRRRGWTALFVGVGGWAAGNLVWSYYELVADQAAPFPSLADAGYLVLPLGAVAGVWMLGPERGGAAARRTLDGVTITASLLLISWSTVIPAIADESSGPLATAIALAYPVSDVAIITVVLLALSGAGDRPREVGLVGAGFAAFAVADSAFAYTVAHGTYETGSWVDIGWMGGFALVTMAAFVPQVDPAASPTKTRLRRAPLPPSLFAYLPMAASLVFIVAGVTLGHRLRSASVILAGIVGGTVMLRQLTVSRENFALAAALAAGEERLRYEATHDSLTGLPNRKALLERLDGLDARGVVPSALAFLDLDGFKAVNDTLGHDAGDALLREVATRMRAAIRPHDFIARLGGDEFAVLWETGDAAADGLAARLLDTVRDPIVVDGHRAVVGISMGIARGQQGSRSRDLLQSSDIAMYAAKAAGGTRFAVFDQTMSDTIIDRARTECELVAALEHDELRLYYQPIVDLSTGRVTGAEALVRWQHPRRGLLAAAEFIPAAERGHLICDLGAWVLKTACSQAVAWDATSPDATPLSVFVNLSVRQLEDPLVVHLVEHALQESRLEPERLVFEVTETTVMTDPESADRVLRALREMGVSIAVDDFGTGYASLTYLRQLPIDIVKIDRSFIDGLGEDIEDTTIVAAVIGLAHQLRLAVTAEGVERPNQLQLLRDMGCSHAQGFLLGRPMPAEEMQPLLARRWPSPSSPYAGDGRCRVVIADDDENDRLLLRRELESDGRFVIVGEAADGDGVVELAAASRPDVAVIDLRMPPGDGLAALPRILLASPGTRVAFLSNYATPQIAERAHAQGAIGFYAKGAPGLCNDLLRAVTQTA